MGCGPSRCGDAGSVMIPARLRPIFRLRMEDFKRRRTLMNATPSKKELLHDDETNAEHGRPLFDGGERRSVSSPEESDSCVTSEDSKGGEKREESGTAKEVAETKDVGIRSGTAAGENQVVTAPPKHEVMVDDVDDEVEEEEEEEEEEDDNVELLSHEEGEEEVFMGSPSFRIYFVDNKKRDKDDDGDEALNKKPAQNGDHATSSAKLQQEPPSPAKKVKKGRKKRSFRRVIPKGAGAAGQAAVKHLLNVRSCYTPSHDRDRTHLLSGKT